MKGVGLSGNTLRNKIFPSTKFKHTSKDKSRYVMSYLNSFQEMSLVYLEGISGNIQTIFIILLGASIDNKDSLESYLANLVLSRYLLIRSWIFIWIVLKDSYCHREG